MVFLLVDSLRFSLVDGAGGVVYIHTEGILKSVVNNLLGKFSVSWPVMVAASFPTAARLLQDDALKV
ncbi:unnamed protein product, partial [Linum tenue]